MAEPRTAEEMVRSALTEVWHLWQYDDEEMMRALNSLNPGFGEAVIQAATRAAKSYARQVGGREPRIYCKYCGAALVRDHVGPYCPTDNCPWRHGVSDA